VETVVAQRIDDAVAAACVLFGVQLGLLSGQLLNTPVMYSWHERMLYHHRFCWLCKPAA
jgi:hypothetical protein